MCENCNCGAIVEKMDTICVMCPMGCSIHVEKCGNEITVSGHTCKRGVVYGKAEFTTPIRMVTSLVRYKDKVVSVRTTEPVAKKDIFKVLAEIKKINIENTVNCGDVIATNIADSGADIIVTANI